MKPEELVRLEAMRDSLSELINASEQEPAISPTPAGTAAVLAVPYISQLGNGADQHNNDCGAAAGAMLVKAYTGTAITPDGFYKKTGMSGDKYLSAYQIMDVMKSFEVHSVWYRDLTLADLFGFLVQKRPIIALISYATLRTAIKTESAFSGPHFAPVVGADVASIYIHDPLWKDEGGKALRVPIDAFNRAWADSGPVNPNLHYGAIVPTVGLGDKLSGAYKAKVTATWLNVREGPDASYPTIGPALRYGELVVVQEVDGKWGRVGPTHWIHLSYTERIED